MDEKTRKVVISEEELRINVAKMGRLISKDYKDKQLYLLALLRGSFIFAADLCRNIDIPVKIGFMTTSSYGSNEQSSGDIEVVNDIPDNIQGFDVLVVDDIIDTGYTMKFVLSHVMNKGAASVKCCTLLDKPSRRKVAGLVPDYCAFTIEDVFVVGYGLNYGDFYRNIPYIFNWEDTPGKQ